MRTSLQNFMPGGSVGADNFRQLFPFMEGRPAVSISRPETGKGLFGAVRPVAQRSLEGAEIAQERAIGLLRSVKAGLARVVSERCRWGNPVFGLPGFSPVETTCGVLG